MYVYPYEALEGFTMALMMTSAVTYVAKISTPTTIASVNTIKTSLMMMMVMMMLIMMMMGLKIILLSRSLSSKINID